MSVTLWSIVAILALIGLVWLFVRDAKRGRAIAPMVRTHTGAMDALVARVNASEAAITNNPAEIMRQCAVASGREVDHASFDRAAKWLAQPVATAPAARRAARKTKPRKQYRYRSAITGRYVKPAYAKRYPHRTVREKVEDQGSPSQ